jgi:hypothetical protein
MNGKWNRNVKGQEDTCVVHGMLGNIGTLEMK